jgi:thiol-disulfide isomerase/thioredoxin
MIFIGSTRCVKQFLLFSIFLSILFSSSELLAQNIEVVRFKDLEKKFTNSSDTTYIVNFFASWCAPCVQELPAFVSFADAHQKDAIKVIFVSLDLKKDYKKTLSPLIIKTNIRQIVFLLNEPVADTWINQIDKNWSGSIPATLFINSKRQYQRLIAESLNFETLNKLLP